MDIKYNQFPVLKSITADKIRVSSGTMSHIVDILNKKLDYMNILPQELNPSYGIKFVNELRNAIPIGIVLTSYPASDEHNPLDRHLEIYSYVDMSKVDAKLEGIAKLKISCRLSPHNNGTLSLRTIQKNFSID